MKKLVIFLSVLILIGGIMVLIGWQNGATLDEFKKLVTDYENYEDVKVELDLEEIPYDFEFSSPKHYVNVVYSEDVTKATFEFKNHIDDEIIAEAKDGKITFKINQAYRLQLFPIYMPEEFRDFTLTLPANIEFKNVEISLLSGKFVAQELNMSENFKASLASGYVNINTLTAANTNIRITSGDIKIDQLDTQNFDFDITSGKLDLNEANIKDINIKAFSGQINLTNVIADTGSITLASGQINLNNCTVSNFKKVRLTSGEFIANNLIANKLDISVVSGNVDITFKVNISDYEIKCSGVSGSFILNGVNHRNNYDNGISNSDKNIQIDMTSGSVKINY